MVGWSICWDGYTVSVEREGVCFRRPRLRLGLESSLFFVVVAFLILEVAFWARPEKLSRLHGWVDPDPGLQVHSR